MYVFFFFFFSFLIVFIVSIPELIAVNLMKILQLIKRHKLRRLIIYMYIHDSISDMPRPFKEGYSNVIPTQRGLWVMAT